MFSDGIRITILIKLLKKLVKAAVMRLRPFSPSLVFILFLNDQKLPDCILNRKNIYLLQEYLVYE